MPRVSFWHSSQTGRDLAGQRGSSCACRSWPAGSVRTWVVSGRTPQTVQWTRASCQWCVRCGQALAKPVWQPTSQRCQCEETTFVWHWVYSSFRGLHLACMFGLNHLHQQCPSPRFLQEWFIYPSPGSHILSHSLNARCQRPNHSLPQSNEEGLLWANGSLWSQWLFLPLENEG